VQWDRDEDPELEGELLGAGDYFFELHCRGFLLGAEDE